MNTNENQQKWDLRYLSLAKQVSTWSKDPSTKVGTVIVRPNQSVASVGFNGFPQAMQDKEVWYNDREEKYCRIVHAEINAIIFCSDKDMWGYTLYSYPFLPCDRCFVQIMQHNIQRVVAPKATEDQLTRWGKAFEKVRSMANDAFIEILELDFV